jgi:hypothetical protein
MAMMTNAQNTYGAIGIREDLTDIVALIDPQDTPFVSNIGLGQPSKTTKHEWQVQELTAPNKSNFQLEGDDAPDCAISRKVGAVTGTDKAVITAGISDEYDNQVMLRGIELRRDQEVILLDNNAYVAGGTTTARECAGLGAYITNTDFTGSDAYSAGTGTGATAWNLANTTSRALSLTILNGALEAAHIDGGKPKMLMLSPVNKRNFTNITLQSSLGGASQVRYNLNGVRPAALIGAVDTWLSNFGQLDVISNVQMASDSGTTNGLDDTAYLIDPERVGVSYLRRMTTEPLSKTGDNDKFMIIAEYTLQVDAPKAHAALFALT